MELKRFKFIGASGAEREEMSVDIHMSVASFILEMSRREVSLDTQDMSIDIPTLGDFWQRHVGRHV